jgi:uncharacterized membrane protein
MLSSILIGAVAGARAMTPLAAVADAARRGALPPANGAPPLLDHPLVSAGTAALALGELAGDKMKTAPDRIVPAGVAGRLVTGAVAGAALAPRDRQATAALAGAAAAVTSSFVTFRARMWALDRYGQTTTGLVEDALTVGSAWWIVNRLAPSRAST